MFSRDKYNLNSICMFVVFQSIPINLFVNSRSQGYIFFHLNKNQTPVKITFNSDIEI